MMKKSHFKHYLLVFMALLAITLLSSLAEANDLYTGWHFSGDTFKVGSDVYTVTHYNLDDKQVILGVNKDSYIINEGDCKYSATRELCITDIYREIDNATEEDHIKFEDGKAYAGIEITIRERRPDISITRAFSTAAPTLNAQVSVNVTIKNEGSVATDSFLYTDQYPEGVELISASSSLVRTPRGVNYSRIIPAQTTQSFIYSFIVNDYLNFTNAAIANYTYLGTNYGIKSASKDIKITRPYELTFTLSQTSLEPGLQSTLTVEIANKIDSTITVKELIISIPSVVSLQPKQGTTIQQQGGQYIWSGQIGGADTKVVTFTLIPSKSGAHNIGLGIKVTDNYGKEINETKNTTLTATIKPLEPILSILENTVSEGARYRVAFSVKNPNLHVSLKNIKASIKSEMFPEMPVSLDMLFTNTTKTLLINDKLEAPPVDANKVFNIEASGTYLASTGELFNFSKKGTLTVTLVSDIVDIVQAIDKKEVTPGNNITVIVTIKNNNNEAIAVDAYDFYSQGLLLIGGKTSATVLFDTAGSKQAYSYKLNIPFEYNSTELAVTTSASIPLKDFYANTTATVNVKLAEPGVPEQNKTNATPQENTTVPSTKPAAQPEAKPGFFESIINTISEFFRRILKL